MPESGDEEFTGVTLRTFSWALFRRIGDIEDASTGGLVSPELMRLPSFPSQTRHLHENPNADKKK